MMRCIIVECSVLTALRNSLASWWLLVKRMGVVLAQLEVGKGFHLAMRVRAVSMFSSINESENVLL